MWFNYFNESLIIKGQLDRDLLDITPYLCFSGNRGRDMVLHASPDGPSQYVGGLGLEPVRNVSATGITIQAHQTTAPRYFGALNRCLIVLLTRSVVF